MEIGESERNNSSSRKLFVEAFLVTTGNPKAIIFFTALFPQFVDAKNNTMFQFFVILLILGIIAFGCMMIYSIFGQKLVSFFGRVKFRKIFHRVVGGTFVGMGIGLATGRMSK